MQSTCTYLLHRACAAAQTSLHLWDLVDPMRWISYGLASLPILKTVAFSTMKEHFADRQFLVCVCVSSCVMTS